MDLQAYTYDALPLQELEKGTEQIGGESLFHTAYCYDKTASAGAVGNSITDVHLFAAYDPNVLTMTAHLYDDHGASIPLTDDGVVITKKIAVMHDLSVGDVIEIESADQLYSARVSGIAENYVNHYLYFTSDYYAEVMGELPGYNCIYTNIAGFEDLSDAERDHLEDSWAMRFLSDERFYTVVYLDDLFVSIWESLSILNYVVVVLILAAGALTFVVMLNLTNINITERHRELATLRVLGFTDKEMYDYIFRENNSLAAIGTAVGLLFGKVLHRFIMVTVEVDQIRFVREIDPASYAYAAAMSIAFAMVVNLSMCGKVRNIDMVESLKSAE